MVDAEAARAVRDACAGARRRVLVTGASGFLGSHLAQALDAAGQLVTATGRNPYASPRLRPARVRFERADLRDAGRVRALCRDQDLVIHAAALCSPWGRAADFAATNVEGTRHVVNGCLESGARLVHVSSTAILFDFRDRHMIGSDQPVPPRAACAYAASKRDAEVVVRRGLEQGADAVIVRARAIFGPGDTNLLPRLIRMARLGRLRQVGKGTNRVDLTYVDNLVYGLVLSGLRAERGAAFTVTNGEAVELWPTIRAILAEAGLSGDLRRVPYPLAYGVGGLLEALWRALRRKGEPPLTRYTAGLLAKEQTFDPGPAEREIGYRPLVSVREGLRRTLVETTRSWEEPGPVQVRLALFTTGLTRHSRHLAERGAEHVRTPFHSPFALLEHPTEGLTLFDAGYAPRFHAATRAFPYRLYRLVTPVETGPHLTAKAVLARHGYVPADVRRIVVSHFHADHVGGLLDFPAAEFVLTGQAWAAVRGKSGLGAVRMGFLPDLLPPDFAERARPI